MMFLVSFFVAEANLDKSYYKCKWVTLETNRIKVFNFVPDIVSDYMKSVS